MAWWTGRAALAVLAWGDSNMLPAGFFTPPGGQTTTPGLYCYASPNGQTVYDEASLGWRNALDPNGDPSRTEEWSIFGQSGDFNSRSAYIGQLVSGSGSPSMQAGSVLKNATNIDTYVFHTSEPGTNSVFWLDGNGWDTLARTVPTALATIPGSPTAFDVILISIGGKEALDSFSEETYYTNMRSIREKMIGMGWWVPGVTQIVFLDMPRSGPFAGRFAAFNGVKKVVARFNDRISITNSAGYEMEPYFPVHYTPPYYTDAGNQAGKLVLNHISKRRAWLGANGRSLSANGSRLTVHAA